MRRFTIFTALVTILSMITIPAMAENNVILTSDLSPNYIGRTMLYEAYDNTSFGSIRRGTVSAASGIAGRDVSDISAFVDVTTPENENSTVYTGYHEYIVGTQDSSKVWSYANQPGYLVMEGSILPVGDTEVMLCTDQNSPISGYFTLNKGVWNKFYTVYRFSDKKAMNVVNGVESDWMQTYLGTTRNDNGNVRHSVRLLAKQNGAYAKMYVDDYKIYLSDDVPELSKPAVLDKSKYTIDENTGNVVLNNGEKVSDITCGEAIVKVYSDSTLTTCLSSSDTLIDGNVIILISGNDYTYYTVATKFKRLPIGVLKEACDSTNLTNSFFAVSRCAATVETEVMGIGGKPSYDAVGKFTATSLTSDGSYNFFTSTTLNVTNKITMALSVVPNDTISGIFFATNSHAALSQVIPISQLKANEWNRLVCVYNPETSKSDLYINGKYHSTTSKAIGTNLRVVFNVATDKFSDGYIYYDDYIIYDGELELPVVTSNTYSIDSTKIHGYGNDTVLEFLSNLTLSNEDYTVEIRDKAGNLMTNDVHMYEGCTVTIYDGKSMIDKYLTGIKNYTISDDIVLATNGYIANDGKFAPGEVKISRKISSYSGKMNIIVVLAQYEDAKLINCSATRQTISGVEDAVAKINLDKAAGTTLKYMLYDSESLAPLCNCVSFAPYSEDKIENVAKLYEGYTVKSMVFNYDDCLESDIRLIELLDKYGMKGTFNLTTNRILAKMKSPCLAATGKSDDESILAFTKDVYKNHEISNHTVNHNPAHLNPGQESTDSKGNKLVGASTADEIADIVNASAYIREHLDAEPMGLAWPNGYGTQRNDYESDLLPAMKECGLKYARGTETGNFKLPTDWYVWNSTCHHRNAPFYAEQYVNLQNSGDMICFFIWGHTFEFDDNKDNDLLNWTMIENVMKTLSNDNIWFATNGDIYKYVEATKLIDVTDTTVTNNSDMTVFCQVNGVNVEIPAGETYSLTK